MKPFCSHRPLLSILAPAAVACSGSGPAANAATHTANVLDNPQQRPSPQQEKIEKTRHQCEAAQQQEKSSGAQAQASASSSTSAPAQLRQNRAELSADTAFEGELRKSLDAKRNKQGDRVEARITQDVKSDGQVFIPKGSKLIGRITQAKARARGESALGIVFERAVSKGRLVLDRVNFPRGLRWIWARTPARSPLCSIWPVYRFTTYAPRRASCGKVFRISRDIAADRPAAAARVRG